MSLYDIDDLQAVVARNLSTRAEEIPRALEIVEEEIHRFARWLGQLDALPTVSALREHGDDDRRAGAGRERRALGVGLARATSRASRRSRARSMSRLLHEPTIRLRSLGEERGHASLELVRELFGLREDAETPRARSRAGGAWRRSTTCAAAASADARIGTPAQRARAGAGRLRRRPADRRLGGAEMRARPDR